MDTEPKQNIFKQFVLSFFNFNAYPGFAKERGGKVFLYSLLIILITFIVTYIVPMLTVLPTVMSLDETVIDEYVPYFEISGGKFYIESPVVMDEPESGTIIYITSEQIFSTETSLDVLRDYTVGIIIDAEKMIVKSGVQQQILSFSTIPDAYFSRADFYSVIPVVKAVTIIMFPVMFVFYIACYMFGALICALIGMAVNAFVKAPLNFGGIFRLTAYARTAPMMLKMLLFLLPLGIPLHFLAFYAMFILYMVWALLAVKKAAEKPHDGIIDVSDISDNF